MLLVVGIIIAVIILLVFLLRTKENQFDAGNVLHALYNHCRRGAEVRFGYKGGEKLLDTTRRFCRCKYLDLDIYDCKQPSLEVCYNQNNCSSMEPIPQFRCRKDCVANQYNYGGYSTYELCTQQCNNPNLPDEYRDNCRKGCKCVYSTDKNDPECVSFNSCLDDCAEQYPSDYTAAMRCKTRCGDANFYIPPFSNNINTVYA